MSVTIRIDTASTVAKLNALALSQLPFATARAVTQTGLDFQKAERARLATIFTQRRPDFIQKQGVKLIGGIATKAKPSITFGVDPKADFLVKFELGTTKTPTQASSLAIPVDIRRNKRDIITRGNRPRALIDRLGNKTGAGSVFILKQRKGRLPAGIYQKTGRGGDHLKLLYLLIPEAKTPRVLSFLDTLKRTIDQRWTINFATALADAIKTAK
jgi:hypothetical protein